MGLGDIYKGLEDKYYGAVDWLDEKGISLYPLIDRIEDHTPSFPIAIVLVLILAAGLFFGLSMLLGPQATLTMTVSDSVTGIGIEGAKVSVSMALGQELTGLTDKDGRLVLAVPIGEATVVVEKTGYEDGTLTLKIEESLEREIELDEGIRMLSRTIQLMETGTSQLLGEEVSVEFRCSNDEASDFSETKTAVAGTIDIEVPSNCGSLIASPGSGFTTPNGVIDIQETSPQLFLQAVETNVGTVQVSVETVGGQALAGITVMVYSEDMVLAGTQYTSPAGSASFANVATGSYYVMVHDSQGRYADFDSSMLGQQGIKELVKDASISFDVKLLEATVGKVKVILKDIETKQPVGNATVYLKKNGLVVDSEDSSVEGIVEFSVGENLEYSLEVDSPAHLIAVESNVRASESFNEIFLEPATSDNTQVLTVAVIDNRQKPIENVRLVLKKSDGTIFANNVVTGGDGTGEFSNLPIGAYYVYAVKKGFEGKDSDSITIRARQENRLTVTLPIGFGNLEVVVLDDELQPVQGAVVEAINVFGKEREHEEITGIDGKTAFNFRADKKVFFAVDSEGFLPYYSIAVMPDADSTVSTTIVLAKDPGKIEVRLLGLYQDEEIAPRELAPGQKYTAKLLLLLPRDSSFDEAGIHLRLGSSDDGKTNIMEEDSLFIKSVAASTASVLRGTSFTPPKGYATDSGHLTTGDSKWANVVWRNVPQGAYAVEAEVQVKESALLNQLLYVSYRGWAKKGSYKRFPNDAALGSAEATNAKQSLYANAEEETYTAGPSNLCGTSFCKTFSIEDTARNLRVNVVKEYSAIIGNLYKLNFHISSISEQAFTNGEIEFGSKGDGLRFENYAVTDSSGLRSEGLVEAYTLSKNIGNLRKGSSTFGFIEFKAEKEGSNIFTIVIKSNNQAVLNETIDIKVDAAEQLQLDVIPKEIIPMIDNEVLVRVSDESNEAVSNAIVTVKIDDVLVLSKESNGSGELEFKLESPPTGSILLIKAEKTGYKAAELEETIDNEILRVTPDEISERLDIALNEVEKQIWFSNQTVTDLVLSKLRFSSDFRELVEFEWDDDYIGKKLDADSDMNAFLLIRLTEKGVLVKKPVKLEGSLSIYVLSPELQQTFVENLPIEVRIGLGGEVDSLKCFEIKPVKWEVIAGAGQSEIQEFEFKNNCSVENSPIALGDLSAKVELGRENALGSFKASSEDLPGSSQITLDDNYSIFADILPAGFEGKITLEFAPNDSVDAGSGKPKIVFRAEHAAAKGEEHVSLSLPVELHVSNLSKCVEVIADEPLEVETTPFNQGFGNYGNSYNPYYQGGYGGYNTGGGGYPNTMGGTGGYIGGGMYPNPNFTSPYYTNYYDRAEDENWRYGLGQNSFIVKNNCASEIEVDIDVPSRLRVKEEKFEIAPNSDKVVVVESGYRMGKYELGVFAGNKGSQDKKQKIDTIDVIVKRAGEMDEECIQLSTNKIKLNSFIGKPVTTSIFNYCYDVGVRLPTAGNVIQFSCKVAGQPMNTYKLEEGQGETISLQDPQAATASGYRYPFAQPSGTFNQGPTATGMYAQGEAYNAQGPWGSAYGQGGLGSQGYMYPQGSYPNGSTGWAQAQVGGYGGRCELIDSVMVKDAYTKGGDEGKTIQVVEFDVKPAINYRKMLCQYRSQMPFQSIFGLRVMLSQAYYRVNVDASANVKYYNPFGGTTNKYFSVTLEDLWGIGDTIDECLYNAGLGATSLDRLQNCRERGTQATAEAVVNKTGLDLTTKGYTKGFVPKDLFGPNGLFFYTADPDILKIPPAGSQDSIVEINPAEIIDRDSGVKLVLTPVKTNCPPPYRGGNWTIKMEVDNSNMFENVACAKIEKQVRLKISRPLFWESPKEVVVPVKVWVLNKKADISTIDPNTCTQAGTGPVAPATTACPSGGDTVQAFKNYGFDRLTFNWEWKDVEKQQCDEKKNGGDEKFCDAVQFSIALSKKASDLKAFVENNEGKLFSSANKWNIYYMEEGENARANWATAVLPSGIGSNYKNSKELFRWAKKQVVVEDHSQGTGGSRKLVFFVKGTGAYSAGKFDKSKVAGDVEFLLNEAVTKENAGKMVGDMAGILEALEDKDEIDEDSIIGVFNKNANTEKYSSDGTGSEKGMFDYLGIEYNNELEKYVWTFKEYKKMHEHVLEALGTIGSEDNKCDKEDGLPAEDEKEAVSCIIKKISNSDDTFTLKFELLRDILNADLEFVVGVRNSEDLKAGSDLARKVIKDAADVGSLSFPVGYDKKFSELYSKAIDFSSFLIKDGYSDDLKDELYEAYKDDGGRTALDRTGFRNWIFEVGDDEGNTMLGQAGLYSVLLDYDFSVDDIDAWTVELKESKGLGEINLQYVKNPFFEMPFDGKVGRQNRKGYGIGFAGVGVSNLKISHKKVGPADKSPRFKDIVSDLKTYTFKYGKTFAETNTGTILSISGNSFNYNPSRVARVEIGLEQRMGSGMEGILYNLVSTDKTDNKAIAASASLFKFRSAGTKQEFKDSVLPPTQARALCPEVGQGLHGFAQNVSGQKGTFIGLVFVPFTQIYELQPVCVQGNASIQGIGEEKFLAGHRVSGGNVKINTMGDEAEKNLKSFIKKIETGEVCFVPKEDGADLTWHGEKHFEKKK